MKKPKPKTVPRSRVGKVAPTKNKKAARKIIRKLARSNHASIYNWAAADEIQKILDREYPETTINYFYEVRIIQPKTPKPKTKEAGPSEK